MNNISRGEIIPQQHWKSLTALDWGEVLAFLSVLELEYQRMETFVGGELTAEVAFKYYDFRDLSWQLFCELAYIGIVCEDASCVDESNCEALLGIGLFDKLEYIELCELLAFCTQNSRMDSGYFERGLKDKTIFGLLLALRQKLEDCIKFNEKLCG